ncbi:MAG: type II toxin-antitoxin system VapC family toxin [Candidatus Dormibacteraeota bacterium]|nr:type II toxin-antitoxin system VapC family toxin [Candidatus Dormibacteraeota bacterium]
MNGRLAYLDTSAFVKLVVREAESTALTRFLARWPERASATLLRAEAIRALRRAGLDADVGAARRLFETLRLVRIDEPLLDRAGVLEPRELRSLDALHLATALGLGPDLGVFVTYDRRMGEAAEQVGLPVRSPA